jgi:hypothetical protein
MFPIIRNEQTDAKNNQEINRGTGKSIQHSYYRNIEH